MVKTYQNMVCGLWYLMVIPTSLIMGIPNILVVVGILIPNITVMLYIYHIILTSIDSLMAISQYWYISQFLAIVGCISHYIYPMNIQLTYHLLLVNSDFDHRTGQVCLKVGYTRIPQRYLKIGTMMINWRDTPF